MDFYTWKHINTTEVINKLLEVPGVSILQAEAQATEMKGHTITQMVREIYDTDNSLEETKPM